MAMNVDDEMAKLVGRQITTVVTLQCQLGAVSEQLAICQQDLAKANEDKEAVSKQLEEVQKELEDLKNPPVEAIAGRAHPLDTAPPTPVDGAP